MNIIHSFFILAIIFALPQSSIAAEIFGTVDAVSGDAVVIPSTMKGSARITKGRTIYEGETVSTARTGEVQIVTTDGSVIALRPSTVFSVDKYMAKGGNDDVAFISLLKGGLRTITGWIGKENNSAYKLQTPTATIGIRGTDFEVSVIEGSDKNEPGTYNIVNEGATVLQTAQGDVEVKPGGGVAFASAAKMVAPALLAGSAIFLAKRHFKMDGKFQQKKQFFRNKLNEIKTKRAEHAKAVHAKVVKPSIYRKDVKPSVKPDANLPSDTSQKKKSAFNSWRKKKK